MMLVLASLALAGTVYINGVRADVPPVTTMAGCEVRFDEAGNVWITAPGYRVAVQSPSGSSYAVTPTPTYTPAPTPTYAPAPTPTYTPTATPAPVAGAVPAGSWWLVTEDNDSEGHTVEVVVNGTLVRRVRSGEAQVILDISPWLTSGTNSVTMTALSGSPGGGMLQVYVGPGSNQSGTVRLDNPAVRYSRRSTDSPQGGSKQYTVMVP